MASAITCGGLFVREKPKVGTQEPGPKNKSNKNMKNQNQEQKPKKKIYKRWWFWGFIIIVLFIVISSIGSNANRAQKVGVAGPEGQTPQKQTIKTETFKIGDKVKLGDYVLTIKGVEPCTSTNQFSQPKSGNKFVVIDITQENQGEDPLNYNVWDYKLQDSEDFTYSTAMTTCKDPGFSSGALQTGQSTRGYITFEIPKENSPAKLIFTPSWISTEQIVINLE